MSEIRSKCEGCGMCCRAIWIPLKHSEFDHIETMKQNRCREQIQYEEKVTDIMDDLTFIIQNWYPLTKEEALERNPHLKTWILPEEITGNFEEMLNEHIYGCSQLDTETGRCRIHDNLPHVCSGYPWYRGRPTESHNFYADDCFYKRDITPEALEEYDRQQEGRVEKIQEPICLDNEVEV